MRKLLTSILICFCALTYSQYDSDAQRYIDTLHTYHSDLGSIYSTDGGATYLTDGEVTDAINQWFIDVKGTGSTVNDNNVYDSIKCYYLNIGADSVTHKYNAVNPGVGANYYSAIYNGTTYHTANGVQGDNSTGYTDTRIPPDSISMSNHNISMYISTGTLGSGQQFGTTGGIRMLVGSSYARYEVGGVGQAQEASMAYEEGYIAGNSLGGTDMAIWSADTEYVRTGSAFGSMTSNLLFMSPNGTNFTGNIFKSFGFAHGLSDAEHIDLAYATNKLHCTLGRGDICPAAPVESDTNHPALWFHDSTDLAVAQANWANPDSYLSTVKSNVLSATSSSDNYISAVANAFVYLMTGTASYATAAIADAITIVRDEEVQNDSWCAYMDAPSVVYDWCFDALTSADSTELQDSIYYRGIFDIDAANASFRYHEAFSLRTRAVSTTLAIEPELPGSNLKEDCDTLMYDYKRMMNEQSVNGAHHSYSYQYRYQIMAPIMWDIVYPDSNYVDSTGYVRGCSDYWIHKLGENGYNIYTSEGDHACDTGGYAEGDANPGAGLHYMISKTFNDSVAQWAGNKMLEGNSEFYYAGNNPPSWLMFMYYHDSVTAVSPDTANWPLNRYFEGTEIISTKSDWLNKDTASVNMYLYSTTTGEHTGFAQNHFEIWKGDDDLAIRGGNYLGTPCDWETYVFKPSFNRNTIGFTTGTATPDEDGGQNTDKYSSTKDEEEYPNCTELEHYTITRYRGEFTYFDTTSSTLIATGDATYSYGQVDYYLRDFVYLKPGLLIINDRYEVDNTVDSVRWIFHSRNKPVPDGSLTLIEGYADSGRFEQQNCESFTVTQGASEALITNHDPYTYTLETRGGGTYSFYRDGVRYHPDTTAQTWLQTNPLLQERKKYITDQYTSFFDAPVNSDTVNNIVFSIYITDTSDASIPPTIIYDTDSSTYAMYDIDYKLINYRLALPTDSAGVPILTTTSGTMLFDTINIGVTDTTMGNIANKINNAILYLNANEGTSLDTIELDVDEELDWTNKINDFIQFFESIENDTLIYNTSTYLNLQTKSNAAIKLITE